MFLKIASLFIFTQKHWLRDEWTITIMINMPQSTITGYWLWDVHGDSFFLFHWNEFRKSSGNLFRQGKKSSCASFTKHNLFILSLNGPLKEYIFWIENIFATLEKSYLSWFFLAKRYSWRKHDNTFTELTNVKIFEIFSVEAVDHSNRVDQFWRENRNCGEP